MEEYIKMLIEERLNPWQQGHYWSEKEGIKLVGWDEKLFTVREVLKRMRKECPHLEFRSDSHGGVKGYRYRFKMEEE